MVRKFLGSMIGLMVVVGLVAGQTKDAKDAKKDAKEIKATIVKVDVEKMTISVTTDDGKKMDLIVVENTAGCIL